MSVIQGRSHEVNIRGNNFLLMIISDSVRGCLFLFLYQYIGGNILTRFECVVPPNMYYDYGLGVIVNNSTK